MPPRAAQLQSQPNDPFADADERVAGAGVRVGPGLGWQEWVLRMGVVLLSLVALWSVFGDDLALLVSPGSSAPPAVSSSSSTAATSGNAGSGK